MSTLNDDLDHDSGYRRVLTGMIRKVASILGSIQNRLMNSRSYIQGPYRVGVRRGLRSFTQEALYAFGGLAAVAYVIYALVV